MIIDPAFLAFTATMSATPGPNNLMLASSGVRHGFRRTLPHLAGVTAGATVQLALVAALVGAALGLVSAARPWLAGAGCLYLLWLSWHIARAGAPGEAGEDRPLGFWGAFLFQGLNPKVWMMSVNAALVFLPDAWADPGRSAAMLAGYAAVNLACISVWAGAGDRLRRFLAKPAALRAFNLAMGGLLAATAVWMLAEELIAALAPA